MKRNTIRYWIALGSILLVCSGHGTAAAQAAADKAAADALYNEAKQLILKAGDTAAVAAACEKFKASVDKLAQIGAQYSLADCYKKIGKTASAWAMYRAAAAGASKANDRRQHTLEQAAAELETKLSRIVIRLETIHRIAGLEIKCDGSPVSPAELGSAIPIDPGDHVVEASAPGRAAWWTRVSIPSNPGSVEVPVPALERLQVPAARPLRRTIAYSLGGGGIALVGGSLVLGAIAWSDWRKTTSESHCIDRMCDAQGISLAGSAKTLANVSTGTFVFGVSALAAAAFLYFTGPETESSKLVTPVAVHLVPGAGPAQVGLTLQGGF